LSILLAIALHKLGDYLLHDDAGAQSAGGVASRGLGDVPSPIKTAMPFGGMLVRLLAAESAPASIRLANIPKNAFFTVESPELSS